MRIKSVLTKNQSGFTLVEVMVTLVIVTMLVGVIGSFLVMHLKSYETTKSVIDIQYEAQLALNRIGKVAMESGGISYITSDSNMGVDNDEASSTTSMTPYAVVFEYASEGIEGDKVVFLFDSVYNRIVFKNIDATEINPYNPSYNINSINSEWYVFANYVDSWTITPNAGATFDESTGINITMNFKKNDAVITVSNSFKYRNKY